MCLALKVIVLDKLFLIFTFALIRIHIVRDLELHLASRMTDRRCRPLWAWNDDHVTGRRWLDGPRLTVGRQTLNECCAGRTGC